VREKYRTSDVMSVAIRYENTCLKIMIHFIFQAKVKNIIHYYRFYYVIIILQLRYYEITFMNVMLNRNFNYILNMQSVLLSSQKHL
jgi:hypothetical protein